MASRRCRREGTDTALCSAHRPLHYAAPRRGDSDHFRSQLTTTTKSLRAAPPRSELIDTYQPRFAGTGFDSTVQMWVITPAPPAVWRGPPEITRSPFWQVACPVAKLNTPSKAVVSRSTSFPKRSDSFPRGFARSASPLLETASALPPSEAKSARMAITRAGDGRAVLGFIRGSPSIGA